MSTARDLVLTIKAGALCGFYVEAEGRVAASFSTAAELAAWIEDELAPLDPVPEIEEPLPVVLQPRHRVPGLGLVRLGRR